MSNEKKLTLSRKVLSLLLKDAVGVGAFFGDPEFVSFRIEEEGVYFLNYPRFDTCLFRSWKGGSKVMRMRHWKELRSGQDR